MSNNSIKQRILLMIQRQKINYKSISSKTGIGLFQIFNIIYNPFYKIKLTQGIALSKFLNASIDDLFDIPFDIHVDSHI